MTKYIIAVLLAAALAVVVFQWGFDNGKTAAENTGDMVLRLTDMRPGECVVITKTPGMVCPTCMKECPAGYPYCAVCGSKFDGKP